MKFYETLLVYQYFEIFSPISGFYSKFLSFFSIVFLVENKSFNVKMSS